ncbi:prepilin-type N-terminal cleavage/methylation domain-containing protein [Nannocystis pusilla]|uniref:Prepilin-type N-terminal cleavage/methylation domain-containing protein n=1 Tax=Nannocystis pusilla TaxID=889268 RepID=A0A9X3EMT6_9BACT|nr:prepilin-type N-terminal cleavage/methylation domain-containing protein [Nannocystis pusilla]MCY1006934.1 prepilin-type N-terminal cleavage/methylation domain-containing protein [Nannocystis pusilla]
MTSPDTKRPRLRPPEQRYAAAGFTLLEVMIAMAVLALSLTSMLTSQMASLRATRYAQTITSVAFLADYQLIETEYIVRKEGGWVLEDKFYEGTFADQGWPDVKYKCIVDFLKLPEFTELRAAKDDTDRANRGESSMYYRSAADQAFTALGMVWTPVKQAIERSIRKVKCTVKWRNGNLDEEFIVNTFWADPEKLKQLPGLGGEAKEGDLGDEKPQGGGAGTGTGTGTGTGAQPAGGRQTGATGPGASMGMGGKR